MSCHQDRILVEGGRLAIPRINLLDSGMYQCLAENEHGAIYASAELKVVGKRVWRTLVWSVCLCLV